MTSITDHSLSESAWRRQGSAGSDPRLRILVAIASYGTRNDPHLQHLLREYRSMPYDVDLVVVSNIPKDLGPDVEVRVGLPSPNPWSLPFAHRPLFIERQGDYDLYIYSEDDTLITTRHVEAFLRATDALPSGEIAGFLRTEDGSDGSLHYSSIHNHYHWDTATVRRRGDDVYAHFTNEHGACYMLTREQLDSVIESGGFSAEPHEGLYDMLVSAATDPYTQCGLEKLLCVSRLDDFSCKHLTNKYVGSIGLPASLVEVQRTALLDIAASGLIAYEPMRVSSPGIHTTRFNKSYYEAERADIVAAVPPGAHRVLSVGSSSGETEFALMQRDVAVDALPLDAVAGRIAAAKGVNVIAASLADAPRVLASGTYDAVLFADVLHFVRAPEATLATFRPLLSRGGFAIVSSPNCGHAAVRWRRVRGDPYYAGMGRFDVSGMHTANRSLLDRWLRDGGYTNVQVEGVVRDRWRRQDTVTGGLLKGLWAETLIAKGRVD